MLEQAEQTAPLYRAVWRWHFYAALFVLPFLFMLSLSGGLMLLSKPVESLLYQHLLSVSPDRDALPAATLLTAVETRYPESLAKIYIPPKTSDQSARFVLVPASASGHGGHNAASTTVFINPYSGQILGSQDPAKTLYAWFKSLHGSLFLGSIGDGLIEIAAGLAVLMLMTGLYLAWPRGGWRSLVPSRRLLRREDWRRLHGLIGWVIAIPLLLFLVSGLAWTNVWGGKLVQPWGSLPGTRFDIEKPDHHHQSMNEDGIHQVPWALEQSALPQSSADGLVGRNAIDLDSIVAIAKAQGFEHYRVHLPRGDHRVWTVSASTIAGDVQNPAGERTLHIDPADGQALAELTFADYPVMGQAMATFVPLHQGDLGLWNWLANLFFMAFVQILLWSGVVLWWKRRPQRQTRLVAPSAAPRVSRGVVIFMLLLSLCFPLSALAMAGVVLLDAVILSRLRVVRNAV